MEYCIIVSSASDADLLTIHESWCDDNFNSSDVYTIVGDFKMTCPKKQHTVNDLKLLL